MFGRSSQFDRSLEKATSQLLLEPDWDSVLQINDCIRQGDIQPKYAVAAIRKKLSTDNPHVASFSLQVLESCVKNCGAPIHHEIATKEFMEFLKDLVKVRSDPVKGRILELIQVWSHAFRNEANYKVVQDTYNLMKLEGYQFPVLKESDAMFSAEKAPDWKDGDCCARCRVSFGMVQRKHHCRNCGEVFCSKCSSKNSIIPKFGIEREVRVCEACYEGLNKPSKKSDDDLPAEYLASPLSKQSQVPPAKTEQEIQEEEELQLALALSKSEHETKEKSRSRPNYGVHSSTSVDGAQHSKGPMMTTQPAAVSAPMIDTSDMDPELARYLNRHYWQQRAEDSRLPVATTTPSAPVATTTEPRNVTTKLVEQPFQNGETDEDQAQFLHALNTSVEIFINRMRSNSQRGRSIANDSSVQSLFTVIGNMHPQLLSCIQEQEDLRSHYEALQDKLAQLRDAREALDALREDHSEKKRKEHEELERQRQIQMAHKLEIMRQKKHEYLEMQRQLALQRLQEQEREMQMRFEQQRQMTQMRQMQNYGYPQHPQQVYAQPGGMQGYPPPPQSMLPGMPQGFASGGAEEGSPVHQMQQPQQSGAYMPPPMGQGVGATMAPGGAHIPPMGAGVPGAAQPQSYQLPGLPSYSQSTGQYPSMMTTQPTSLPGYGLQTDYQPPVQYSSPQVAPAMAAPSSGYASMPPGQGQAVDYQSFNMQSMANALPQQSQAAYSTPQQQFSGNMPQSAQGASIPQPPSGIPQQGQHPSAGIPQQPPQGIPQQPPQGIPQQPPQGIPQQYQQMAPQQQQAGPPPIQQQIPQQPPEAELISFE